MQQHVDIVFFGTSKTGDERTKVVNDVRRLLKLNEQQAENLFNKPGGAVLLSTQNRDKALQLVQALHQLGADCTLREAPQSQDTWQQWELEETKAKARDQRFKCLSCGHEMAFPPGEELPDVCPECGVVQSKYESVAAKKHEREKIKRSILHAREAQNRRDEEEAERLRQEALRKEIEKELRRELEAQSAKKRFVPMIGTGAAMFVLGIGVALGVLALTGAGDETDGAPGSQVATVDTTMGQAAITIANDIVGRMGGPLPAAGQGEPMTARVSASGQPQLIAPSLPGQLPAIEPTSAGATVEGPGVEATPEFFAALADDPLIDARRQHEFTQQINLGEFETAGAIRALATSPVMQVGMQSQAAFSNLDGHSAPVMMYEMQRMIANAPGLEEKAFGTLALENLAGAAAGTPQREDLLALFQPGTEGTLDRLKAEALIASTRAKQGDIAAAQGWFDSANQTLQAMRDPIDQLKALPALAEQYFDANDRDTALALLGWTRQGLVAMPPTVVREGLAESVAAAYATVGQIDEAAATLQFFFPDRAGRDLQLARLARETALNGQVLPAEGLMVLIKSDAQRAVARAQTSLIAKYEGQYDAARSLIEHAHRDSTGLDSPARQVVASELLRASTDTAAGGRPPASPEIALEAPTAGEGAAIDQAKAVIAKNLAWIGDRQAANEMTQEIDDPRQRRLARQAIDDIEKLAAITASATAVR